MLHIFVHGLGQIPASWDNTIENIKQLDNICCPDLCEMLKGKDVTYSALYSSFAEYCNKFDEPINFCGLSLGGVLVLNYAIENPMKVNSLALIATQYKMPKGLLKFQNFIFGLMPAKMFMETGFSKKDFITLSKTMMEINPVSLTSPLTLWYDSVTHNKNIYTSDDGENKFFGILQRIPGWLRGMKEEGLKMAPEQCR